MPEWLKGADCKSASESLRWFESISTHHFHKRRLRGPKGSLFCWARLRGTPSGSSAGRASGEHTRPRVSDVAPSPHPWWCGPCGSNSLSARPCESLGQLETLAESSSFHHPPPPLGNPRRCQSIPRRCQPIPKRCQLIPSRCQLIPNRCQLIPSRCQLIPSRCQLIPSRCQSIPRRCQSIPSRCQPQTRRCQTLSRSCPSIPHFCQ